MNKQRILVLVNILLGVLIISQFATVILMESLDTGFAEDLHEVNGFIIFGLIIVHVALNWRWVKQNVFKR